jgi:hypothetical protein
MYRNLFHLKCVLLENFIKIVRKEIWGFTACQLNEWKVISLSLHVKYN